MSLIVKTGFAVLLLFLLCSCGTKGGASANVTQSGPTWEILVSETQTPIEEPMQAVLKTQQEFDKIWDRSQEGITMGPSKPSVDFSRKWVVAAFLGWVKTAGHKLEIRSVEPGPTATVITLLHTQPAPGCPAAQVIEMPYLFASIDPFRPEKTEFRIVTEEVPCD